MARDYRDMEQVVLCRLACEILVYRRKETISSTHLFTNDDDQSGIASTEREIITKTRENFWK